MTTNQTAVPTPESLLQHASWAHSLARSLVGEAAADDLVQDTWLAALKAEPSTDRSLKPWLGTVIGNLSRQRSRGASRRQAREAEAVRDGSEPSASELTERAESQKLLMEQLLHLDEDLREALLLKYFEGLSAAEIGRRKNLPASTVKTRLQRGLEAMRISLESHFGGDRSAWNFALLPLLRVDQAKRAGIAAASGGIGLKLVAQILLWIMAGTLGVITLVSLIGNLPLFEEAIPIEAVTFKPLAPLQEPAALVNAVQSLREPIGTSGIPAGVPAVSQEKADSTLLKVRFLDEQGQPVSGVRLRARWGRAESKRGSDLQGRLEFAFALDHGRSEDSVIYHKQNVASDVLSFVHHLGEAVDLGDVVVVAGGALSGIVVDGFGEPLVGAEVNVDGADVVESAAGGMTTHTRSSLGAAESRTNERGEFRLAGLLVGNVRVKVRAQRGLHKAESGWVPIRAGKESQGLVIVAPEVPREQRLEGYVLDPEGNPVASASVRAKFKTFFQSGSQSTTTDRNGFFRIFVSNRASHDMEIRGPSDCDWSPIFIEDVELGQVDMRIQFQSPAFFTLRVVGADGAEIEGSTCAVYDGSSDQFLQQATETKGSPGKLELRMLDHSVVLRVQAPRHVEERMHLAHGKISAGSTLTITLPELPGVTGRLLFDGEPVAGAKVFLQRKARGKNTHNGFPVRLDSRSESSTRSEADGTFYLDARKSGQYVVRAVAEGLAPRESAFFQLSPREGVKDMELQMSKGGSIEGSVILQGNSSPAGKFVAISRGDCWAETYRVASDGAFRFENLTPGNWMVKLVDGGINDANSSSSSTSSFFADVTIPSNCSVQEGSVTHHDIVPVPLSACLLRGRLELEGVNLATWRGSLSPESLEDGSQGGIRPGFTMDSAGNFELRVRGAGKWNLSFQGPGDMHLTLRASLVLVKGVNHWGASVPTGSLTLTGELHEACVYVWQGSDGLIGTVSLVGNEDTPITLSTIPAGPAKLMRLRDVPGLDPSGPLPPAWVELNVPEGANQTVSLTR